MCSSNLNYKILMNSTTNLIFLSWTLNKMLTSNSSYSDISNHFLWYLDALQDVCDSVRKPAGDCVAKEIVIQSIPVPTMRQVKTAAVRGQLSHVDTRKLLQLTRESRTLWRCLTHHVLTHDLVSNSTMHRICKKHYNN